MSQSTDDKRQFTKNSSHIPSFLCKTINRKTTKLTITVNSNEVKQQIPAVASLRSPAHVVFSVTAHTKASLLGGHNMGRSTDGGDSDFGGVAGSQWPAGRNPTSFGVIGKRTSLPPTTCRRLEGHSIRQWCLRSSTQSRDSSGVAWMGSAALHCTP